MSTFKKVAKNAVFANENLWIINFCVFFFKNQNVFEKCKNLIFNSVHVKFNIHKDNFFVTSFFFEMLFML